MVEIALGVERGRERVDRGADAEGEARDPPDVLDVERGGRALHAVGADLARDYFIACTADAALLWVYRERSPAGAWYLHGIFS